MAHIDLGRVIMEKFKTDLAEIVGADLKVMERDARQMRGEGPFLFAQVKNGVAMTEIIMAVAPRRWQRSSCKSCPIRSRSVSTAFSNSASKRRRCRTSLFRVDSAVFRRSSSVASAISTKP